MARIFYAVIASGCPKFAATDSEEEAKFILGELPRKYEARIATLTEATPDRVAEIKAIRAASDALEFTSANDRESAAKIIEARGLLRTLLGDEG